MNHKIGHITSLRDSSFDAPHKALIRLVGLSNYFAIATVAARQRVAGRLIVRATNINRLSGLVAELGLVCRRARFDFLELPSPVPGTHNCGSFVLGSRNGAKPILYFGIDAGFAEGAETAEFHEEHALVGRLFGYPDCCVTFYTENEATGLDKLPSSITSTGPFPREMNPVLSYVYGCVNLLFHFPCSPHCRASLTMRQQRLNYLSRFLPSAQALANFGFGIAVYGPAAGIALITRYRELESDCYEVEAVATRNQETKAIFSADKICRIRLLGPHAFEIGARTFVGVDQFAARFI
jgi:hypothetical protein